MVICNILTIWRNGASWWINNSNWIKTSANWLNYMICSDIYKIVSRLRIQIHTINCNIGNWTTCVNWSNSILYILVLLNGCLTNRANSTSKSILSCDCISLSGILCRIGRWLGYKNDFNWLSTLNTGKSIVADDSFTYVID